MKRLRLDAEGRKIKPFRGVIFLCFLCGMLASIFSGERIPEIGKLTSVSSRMFYELLAFTVLGADSLLGLCGMPVLAMGCGVAAERLSGELLALFLDHELNLRLLLLDFLIVPFLFVLTVHGMWMAYSACGMLRQKNAEIKKSFLRAHLLQLLLAVAVAALFLMT